MSIERFFHGQPLTKQTRHQSWVPYPSPFSLSPSNLFSHGRCAWERNLKVGHEHICQWCGASTPRRLRRPDTSDHTCTRESVQVRYRDQSYLFAKLFSQRFAKGNTRVILGCVTSAALDPFGKHSLLNRRRCDIFRDLYLYKGVGEDNKKVNVLEVYKEEGRVRQWMGWS